MHNVDCRRQLSPRPAYLAAVPLVPQMYRSVSPRGWQSSLQTANSCPVGMHQQGQHAPALQEDQVWSSTLQRRPL